MNTTIFKDFSKYVTFNILGQIAYSCYTLADTFFVSSDIGTNGLTALNLAFPVFCIISGTGLMIGVGGSTRFSILKSRKDVYKRQQPHGNNGDQHCNTNISCCPEYCRQYKCQRPQHNRKYSVEY